jgi:phage tail sheath protein FI
MAIYLRPGVYVEETLNPVAPAVGPNSQTVAAFIGATDRGPVVPTLVNSWSEYTSLYGTWNTVASNDLPIAILLFFSNGGSQAYIHRVVANSTKAERTFLDANDLDTLKLVAKNPGLWGNSIYISIANSAAQNTFDVTINYLASGASGVVERFNDVSMESTDDRYVVSLINSQSKYVDATDMNSASTLQDKRPVNQTVQALAGVTTNGTVTATNISGAVSSFDAVLNSLVLNAPGVTDTTAVNQIISYAATREDIFVVIDPETGVSVASVLSKALTYTGSSFAAVYYPRIVMKDPTVTTPNVTLTVAPGGAIVGKFISTDSARGVFKAPAGLSTRLAGAVSVTSLTNTELDTLNATNPPVNAIRFISGSGIVVMGARTLKPGYSDRYIPVRRTLIYLRKALTDLTQFAIFEPNDQRLWRQLTSVSSSFLTEFWQQGGLRGDTPEQAYFVKCDDETNTLASIDNGEVRLEIGVALQRPAEFVVIKIGQFDGGTTVTVE